MAVEFVFDPMFDRNLRHTRGSLNPVGNVVRRRTDEIAAVARERARLLALNARVAQDTVSNRYTTTGRQNEDRARALAWALEAYAEDVQAIMLGEPDGVATTEGRVVAYYSGSAAIEFGGRDPNVELGNTGEYLRHTPHAILRSALLKGSLL